MKKLFIQKIDLLDTELVVASCKTEKELIALVNKSKIISKKFKESLKDDLDVGDCHGCLIYNYKTHKPLLLYIKDTKQDWSFFETLLHETNHAVYRFSNQMNFTRETEFQARLHEVLFREIRKKLQCG